MVLRRSVPSAVLLVTVFLLLHTGPLSARTLGLEDADLADFLSKRNSWWSKKSVDTPDLRPVVSETILEARDVEDNPPQVVTRLYDCYTSSCVPDFIACAARSRTTEAFDGCKLGHRACALRCWVLATDDSITK